MTQKIRFSSVQIYGLLSLLLLLLLLLLLSYFTFQKAT